MPSTAQLPQMNPNLIPQLSRTELQALAASLLVQLQDRDAQLSEREAQLHDRDAAIHSAQQLLAAKDQELTWP